MNSNPLNTQAVGRALLPANRNRREITFPHETAMHQMKKLLTLLVVCVLLLAGQARAADLDAPYTPTRAEWLRVYLAENIKISTDSWPVRIRVMITVVNKNQQVMITLMQAYGEKKPTREQRDTYIALVTDMAKRVLESYAWSMELKLDVYFVSS